MRFKHLIFMNHIKLYREESAAQGLVDAYKQAESGSTWLATNDNPAKDITGVVTKAYDLLYVHAME